MLRVYATILHIVKTNYSKNSLYIQYSMNVLIGYILLMTLMFSLAAGLYFGFKTIRLI